MEAVVGVAWYGTKLRRPSLASLTNSSAHWSRDIVKHYGWIFAGKKFFEVLDTAASSM